MKYKYKKKIIKEIEIDIKAGDVLEWTHEVSGEQIRAVVIKADKEGIIGLCFYDNREANYSIPHKLYFYPYQFLDRLRKMEDEEWDQ